MLIHPNCCSKQSCNHAMPTVAMNLQQSHLQQKLHKLLQSNSGLLLCSIVLYWLFYLWNTCCRCDCCRFIALTLCAECMLLATNCSFSADSACHPPKPVTHARLCFVPLNSSCRYIQCDATCYSQYLCDQLRSHCALSATTVNATASAAASVRTSCSF